jgi:superfamily II DNA or RNA helicase
MKWLPFIRHFHDTLGAQYVAGTSGERGAIAQPRRWPRRLGACAAFSEADEPPYPPMPVHMKLEAGQRVRLPEASDFVTIDGIMEAPGGWKLYLKSDDGRITPTLLTHEQAGRIDVLAEDGAAESALVLAGLWTGWMRAATFDSKATALATTPLRPFIHQTNAVYGAMLPQPRLRFLLADEPGTGKTIMAGMYLREMQRMGFVRRALIVAPAHLVGKWQADFKRFFGVDLRRIQSTTVDEGALSTPHELWIVSLDLAAVNPSVQEAIRRDRAGWEVVVFDEAHRLTPTAQAYYRVGELLCRPTPHALLMTATPHRGKESLFRALMHLVDPEVFAPSDAKDDDNDRPLRPGPLHFLRRMKEDLVDHDGVTPLFKGRRARNIPIALNSTEAAFYQEALELVDRYFPPIAVPLAKMVYGKRAASSLFALGETLRRRRDMMGSTLPVASAMESDPDSEDPPSAEEAKVIVEESRSAKAERKDIDGLLTRLSALLRDEGMPVSKWPRMVAECLKPYGISPGTNEQAVIFTEFADTADWLVRRLRAGSYRAERYSGRDPQADREKIRDRFARRQFEILVSTDAGNEGIDLQTAHVLLNWDIPWSLVRLEQRMGRIHRIGQTRDVELFNLIATDTREGAVLHVLLDNFVKAANLLNGRMFDSLSLVGEMVDLTDADLQALLARTFHGDPARVAQAMEAARAITSVRLEAAARRAAQEEDALKTAVDVAGGIAALQRETLERINPRIVEAFLDHQAVTRRFTVTPHAAGSGLFVLARGDGRALPSELGGGPDALVASSGVAIRDARANGADISGAINLGPSEPGFRALVSMAVAELHPSLFRGGPLRDRTSATSYDLFSYEVELAEGGQRGLIWPCLVRVDETGSRPQRWEVLANLEVGGVASRLHPAHRSEADERVRGLAQAERDRRASAWNDWLSRARHELERLPANLIAGIKDADQRRAERKRLDLAVRKRLQELTTMASVTVGEVRSIGWAHVEAAGLPLEPKEMDSENIAMQLVVKLLREDGWQVADVHTEGVGYDLHAKRGAAQRCVEVKGVWDLASSSGISLHGHEVLIARQLQGDYWLYVADQCSNSSGRLYGVYPNPVTMFEGLMRDQSIVKVPGSALKAARVESNV